MSHDVIIIGQRPPGRYSEPEMLVNGEIRWTPSHDLAPGQERRRIERAQRKFDEALGILAAPVSAPDE